ncbi:MAG: cell filamentation protein Fic [Bacteroidetes bacterium]|nr:MAG: cell filamentation protein Fic [Bacteroidota bacterium]
MKKIEQAPNWKNEKLLNKGLKLFINNDYKKIIDEINDKYLYWDKIKYIKTPQKINPEELWSAVKFSRTIHSKEITFGKYKFSYNLTDFIQKRLHEFDLNIGGQLGAKTTIPEEDKKRYLISSIMEEAIASSQIEGAVTTRKKAKEMLRKNKKPRTKSEQMILNNYNTIKNIVENQNQLLTEQTLFKIHKLITHQTLDDSKNEGKYRENNDVNVVDVINGEIVHTPPDYTKISKLMNELFIFFNKNDKNHFIHPIIKGCIIHFMIGFLHPFIDGNGRTARALFYWYLLKNGYWFTKYLSISRLIAKSKTQYALAYMYSEIDGNDISYFINYKLKTMNLAFESLREYIKRKINEKKQYIHFQKIIGINERQALILKWVYEEPDILLTVKEIENRFNISNQTGRTDLYELVEKGYIELIGLNKKTKAFCKSKDFEKILKIELPQQ